MIPLDEARRIAAEAREAKREVGRARRRARREQERLRRFCEKYGIELELVSLTQSEEGQSHATDPRRVA